MQLEFYKCNEEKDQDGHTVLIWKFIDGKNNIWCTETPLDGTEEDAASIILASVVSA